MARHTVLRYTLVASLLLAATGWVLHVCQGQGQGLGADRGMLPPSSPPRASKNGLRQGAVRESLRSPFTMPTWYRQLLSRQHEATLNKPPIVRGFW